MDVPKVDRKWYPFIAGGIIVCGLCMSFLLFHESDTEMSKADDWLLLNEEVQSGELEEDVLDETIIVDVKGEVNVPGVYKVSTGDRVHDVLQLAGGFTESANESVINLAEKCYDEMVIYVPSVEEEFNNTEHFLSANTNDSRVKVNVAEAAELTTLPGIGPAKADAIISYREENGPFQSVEDLVNVPGIGEKTVEQLKDSVSTN